MSVQVAITLKQLPTKCGECPFYSEPEYRCHSERGNEARCGLGYMRGEDMRDSSYKEKLYPRCQLKDNVINNQSIH